MVRFNFIMNAIWKTLHTIIASISSWDTGILLGCSEAFPPGVMLEEDLEKKFRGASSVEVAAWFCDEDSVENHLNC